MPFFDTLRNPPPTGAVDRFVRCFNSVSYGLAVLSLYAIGASALGIALASALWLVRRWGPGAVGIGRMDSHV